jgi:hypothetical protein
MQTIQKSQIMSEEWQHYMLHIYITFNIYVVFQLTQEGIKSSANSCVIIIMPILFQVLCMENNAN